MGQMTLEEPPADVTAAIAAEIARARPAADVIVHHLRLDEADADEAAIRAHLHAGDNARADSLVCDAQRRRLRRARAALRALLSAYLGRPARELRIAQRDDGKPFLDAGAGGGLAFNASRSGDDAVIAVARGRAVGADVERTDRAVDVEAMARIALTQVEAERLAQRAREERRAAFLRMWTVKEAVLKAYGAGLRRSPAAVATPLALQEGGAQGEAELDGAHYTVFDASRPGRIAAVALAAA